MLAEAEQKNENKHIRKLWLNVILRAQAEAEGHFLYVGNVKALQYRAVKWLTTYSRSLQSVCELATGGKMTDKDVRDFVARNRVKYGKAGERKWTKVKKTYMRRVRDVKVHEAGKSANEDVVETRE